MNAAPRPVRNSNQLGLLLRELRLARRMTQRDLASRLGLSQPRVAAIEKQPGRITVDQLLSVLNVLGATAMVAPGRIVDMSGQVFAPLQLEAGATVAEKGPAKTPEGEW